MNQHITIQKIEHNGVVVTERGEMMSLTDMWKAAGSPSGRAPADWLALVGSKEFVECVVATLEAGNPGIQTKRGGRKPSRRSDFGGEGRGSAGVASSEIRPVSP